MAKGVENIILVTVVQNSLERKRPAKSVILEPVSSIKTTIEAILVNIAPITTLLLRAKGSGNLQELVKKVNVLENTVKAMAEKNQEQEVKLSGELKKLNSIRTSFPVINAATRLIIKQY